MSGRSTEAAHLAARLVAGGLSYRAAAQQAGVSLSTCQRACAAAGIASANPVGRPASSAPTRKAR